MKALAISYSGMEDITQLEIKELIGKESEVKESCVVFECSEEELAKYCYKCQGANRVILLLDEFKISKIEDLERISKIDFSKWLDKKSFAARSWVVENELENSDVQKTTGDYVEGKVDLKNPDVTVFVYIYSNDCYVGIDFSGEISKRDYKIRLCRDDLKGTIAYALVRLSGYSSEKSFLNLNSKTGTIAIEAALFGSGKSVNYYDKKKFPFLKFMDYEFEDSDLKEVNVYASDSPGYLKVISTNAKVAGVNIKFEEVKADCVVKYERGKAEVSGLKESREIKHGKEVLKIVSFIS
ncbi:MAG: THUMP domain-containing protein [Candidatus Woesearchaeota archaeon]